MSRSGGGALRQEVPAWTHYGVGRVLHEYVETRDGAGLHTAVGNQQVAGLLVEVVGGPGPGTVGSAGKGRRAINFGVG